MAKEIERENAGWFFSKYKKEYGAREIHHLISDALVYHEYSAYWNERIFSPVYLHLSKIKQLKMFQNNPRRGWPVILATVDFTRQLHEFSLWCIERACVLAYLRHDSIGKKFSEAVAIKRKWLADGMPGFGRAVGAKAHSVFWTVSRDLSYGLYYAVQPYKNNALRGTQRISQEIFDFYLSRGSEEGCENERYEHEQELLRLAIPVLKFRK